jgi:hypothetical protein
MIFRRRTTDQVYATLQQVQRRITEQGGSAVPAPAPAPRQPGTAPFRNAGTPMRTPPAGTLPAMPARRDTPLPPGDATPLPMSAPLHASAPLSAAQRRVLELPTQLAATLMLVWLLTLVVAFLIGRLSAPASAEIASAPVVQALGKPQDPEAPAPGKRLGDSIFVLRAIPRFEAGEKTAWKKRADELNEQSRKLGYKDYFSVREPENGGLELVYGFANGQYGIDRAQFRDFAAMLQRPKEKGGAGYVAAAWKSVE